ncbi:MAG: hypothetical protein IPI49_25815 [Myxococcales bacterium]|nr:hypothetical protein [Myxococcales bacterium]
MMRTLGKTVLLTSLFAFSATACVEEDNGPEGLNAALPTAEQLSIKLPESNVRAVGQMAEFYGWTRGITRTLNGGSAWVLILLHSIVEYPVTSVEGNVYTWGPWGQGLDPAEYKLVVTALANGTFEYQLAGRPRNTTGAFETVISGTAIPGATDAQAKGQVLLDFDAAERVNPVDNNDKGQLTIRVRPWRSHARARRRHHRRWSPGDRALCVQGPGQRLRRHGVWPARQRQRWRGARVHHPALALAGQRRRPRRRAGHRRRGRRGDHRLGVLEQHVQARLLRERVQHARPERGQRRRLRVRDRRPAAAPLSLARRAP